MNIHIKRIYDVPEPGEGTRILVDRLWPRGLSKERARVDLWLKEIAPSNDLRRWYHHERDKWPEFRARYFAELDAVPDAVAVLRERLKAGTVVLLYGSREPEYNNARALKEYLEHDR